MAWLSLHLNNKKSNRVERVTRLGVCEDVAPHESPMSTINWSPEGSQTDCHNHFTEIQRTQTPKTLEHGCVVHYFSAQNAERTPVRVRGLVRQNGHQIELHALSKNRHSLVKGVSRTRPTRVWQTGSCQTKRTPLSRLMPNSRVIPDKHPLLVALWESASRRVMPGVTYPS